MTAVSDARTQLAAAVTAAGIDCAPYAPDALIVPAAWVETISVDYTAGGWSFCGSGPATARITAAAPRNDRAGSLQQIEDMIPAVNTALEGIGGVQVVSVETGDAEISNQTLPAVIWTVRFTIAETEGAPR